MKEKPWKTMSPYKGGFLMGVVLILSVWIAGKFFGASTTFARKAGMVMNWFSPEKVSSMAYFVKYEPKIDWQWMFLLGMLIGSFIAAMVSGSFKLQALPDMWEKRFGRSVAKRAVISFFGGAIALFGARLAGGCPTGHGLSGMTQLSVSGLISLVFFFIGGIVTARLLYGGGKGK
ncbi:MAG: YeeE/YedE family protein [Candidatus Coatesbacteria bacterium]|nr:YeeE/YedE family protein [Candidatus Coatesbacteria bacterium]